MYIRTKKVKNGYGKIYEYEQIVESYKVGGKTKQKVIMTLGKKGEIAPEYLEKLIGTLIKKNPILELVRQFDQKDPDLKIHSSKEFGVYFIFRNIWEKLHLQSVVEKIAPNWKNKKEFAEMVYLLSLYRILDPGSERRMSKTFEPKVYNQLTRIPKLNEWYRVIGHLQKKREIVETLVYEQVKGLFGEEMKLLFFDTTTLILFGEYKDSEIAQYGYSKQKRSDKKQIIVGMVLNEANIPVGITEEVGNKNDVINFASMLEKMKEKYQAEEVIFVGDKGMNSAKNRETLQVMKQKYILGVRAQSEKKVSKIILDNELDWSKAKPMDYTKNQLKLIKKLSIASHEQENYQTKVLEKTVDGRRMVFFFNPIEKYSEETKRMKIIQALQKKIRTIGDLKKLIGNKGYRSLLTFGTVTKKKALQVKIDYEKIKHLELFDGITVVDTNTDLTSVEVAKQYKQLITVEHSFADLKSTMECHPIHHKTDTNIKGHIFINFLGLLLYYSFFYMIGDMGEKSRYEIINALKEIQIHLVEQNKRKYLVRTELTPLFQNICSILKIRLPERILGRLER